MNPEIQYKVKLWRPTDDTGMLLNSRKSLTLRQATETGISGRSNKTAKTRISRKVATFEAN